MVFNWFHKDKQGGAGRGGKGEPTFETTVAQDLPDAALGKAVVGDSELLRKQRASLQEIIRECMIASGILSAGYKFKIFSADPTHQQFLVLFELSPEFATDTSRLTDMEVVIQSTALRRYQLHVKSCYWRVVPDPKAAAQIHQLQSSAANVPSADAASPEPAPDLKAMAKAQLADLFGNNAPIVNSRETEFPRTVFTSTPAPVLPSSQSASLSTGAGKAVPKGYEETEMAQSQFKTTILQRKD